MSKRTQLVVFIGAIFAVWLVLQVTVPHPAASSPRAYPSADVARFMSGCQHNGGSPALCTCLIGQFQAQYTFEEFQAIAKGPANSAEQVGIARACAAP